MQRRPARLPQEPLFCDAFSSFGPAGAQRPWRVMGIYSLGDRRNKQSGHNFGRGQIPEFSSARVYVARSATHHQLLPQRRGQVPVFGRWLAASAAVDRQRWGRFRPAGQEMQPRMTLTSRIGSNSDPCSSVSSVVNRPVVVHGPGSEGDRSMFSANGLSCWPSDAAEKWTSPHPGRGPPQPRVAALPTADEFARLPIPNPESPITARRGRRKPPPSGLPAARCRRR